LQTNPESAEVSKFINLPLYYVLMILLVVEVNGAQFSDVILVEFLLILLSF